jgi:hypothetical protein
VRLWCKLQNAEQAKENGLPPPPVQPIPQGKEEEEMRNPKWVPLFTLPMIIKDQDQYPVRLCMNETSAFLAGSEEGDLFMCDWGGGKKEEGQEEGAKASGVKQPIKSIQRDHVHTSMAVQRSPHFADMFLTVGDWSFNIWRTGIEVRLRSGAGGLCCVTCVDSGLCGRVVCAIGSAEPRVFESVRSLRHHRGMLEPHATRGVGHGPGRRLGAFVRAAACERTFETESSTGLKSHVFLCAPVCVYVRLHVCFPDVDCGTAGIYWTNRIAPPSCSR